MACIKLLGFFYWGLFYMGSLEGGGFRGAGDVVNELGCGFFFGNI